VVETDYPGGEIVLRNIRQIQPIVDCLGPIELPPPNVGGGLGLPNEAGGVTSQSLLDRSE